MRNWKRRLSELVAEAREITSTLLFVDDGQELADEITARLRALRSGQVSVDAGQRRVSMPRISSVTVTSSVATLAVRL